MQNILSYDMHPDVAAFSAMRECGEFRTMDDGTLPFPVICGHQVHKAEIAIVDRPDMTREDLEGYDALITQLPDCGIGVRTADCVPVLLFDYRKRVIAAIHAGWKGTVLRISQLTIKKMHEAFGCEPKDIIAQIGPSIGPDSFQVGEEVVERFRDAGFPMEEIHSWQGEGDGTPMSGGHHIDLWKANRWLLTDAGIAPQSITIAAIDTYTDERFFSARREGTRCGRIINAIRLRSTE